MKLLSFTVPTPMGRQTRLGAIGPEGRIVDLAAAYRSRLLSAGLTDEAATRISVALLPSDMVAFIEGAERSLDAAREALAWAHSGHAELDATSVFAPAD